MSKKSMPEKNIRIVKDMHDEARTQFKNSVGVTA